MSQFRETDPITGRYKDEKRQKQAAKAPKKALNTNQTIYSQFPTQSQRRQALRILMHIARTGQCFQTNRTIAQQTKILPKNIQSIIHKLIQYKLVQYEYSVTGLKILTCNKNHKPFVLSEIADMQLTPATCLIAHAIFKTNGNPTSIPELAQQAFCQDRQAQRAIKELEEQNIIQTFQSKPFLPKIYRITDHILAKIPLAKRLQTDGDKCVQDGDMDGDMDGDKCGPPLSTVKSCEVRRFTSKNSEIQKQKLKEIFSQTLNHLTQSNPNGKSPIN